MCLLAAGSAAARTDSSQTSNRTLVDVSVRLSFTASPNGVGFYVAKGKGWYQAAGLNVSIGEGTGSSAVAQLVNSGRDTFGYITMDTLIRQVAGGLKLRMVALPTPDAAFGVMVKASSGIQRPQDMAGRTYFGAAAGTEAVLFPLWLDAIGVPRNRVRHVFVAPAALLPGFLSGQFEAVAANEFIKPSYSVLGPIRFFKFSDVGIPTPGWGIVTTPDNIRNNPANVRRFVQISLRGFRWAFDNPRQVDAIVRSQLPTYSYTPATTYFGTRYFAAQNAKTKKPLGWMSLKDWGAAARLLKKEFGLTTLPGAADLYTNQFIPPAKR